MEMTDLLSPLLEKGFMGVAVGALSWVVYQQYRDNQALQRERVIDLKERAQTAEKAALVMAEASRLSRETRGLLKSSRDSDPPL